MKLNRDLLSGKRHWRRAIPSLSGSHVTLREVAPIDAASLSFLLSDPEVTRHLSAPPASRAQFERFIRQAIADRESGRGAVFAVVPHEEGVAAGVIQVRRVDPQFRVGECGIALARAVWGGGAFLESAMLGAAFAFGSIGVEQLLARVATTNKRANAAMRKLGAVAVKEVPASFEGARPHRREVIWSITSADVDAALTVEPSVSAAQALSG
jgi:RimJ/RimL family protein N-acetyltransferase